MRATKLNLFIILVFTLSITACGLQGNAQKKQATPESRKEGWVDYGPAVVELEGKLTIETFFGPPNFGENPKTDSKEQSSILSLNKPINVKGKADSDPEFSASAENVQNLQLVLSVSRKELIGKKVIVKGTLFHAHTGHHHTDVLMNVESISLAAPD